MANRFVVMHRSIILLNTQNLCVCECVCSCVSALHICVFVYMYVCGCVRVCAHACVYVRLFKPYVWALIPKPFISNYKVSYLQKGTAVQAQWV